MLEFKMIQELKPNEELLEIIKNYKTDLPLFSNHKDNFNFKDKIRVVYNDLTSEKILNHSIERIENFKNNIFQIMIMNDHQCHSCSCN